MSLLDFSFVTDTATLCIFDIEQLKHHLDSDADWWCWPPDAQLTELSKGNVAFVDLGADGRYFGSVQAEPLQVFQFQFRLNTQGGRLFIGAGEEVTSEGLEPECIRGGLYYPVSRACSLIQISRDSDGKIHLAVLPSEGSAENQNALPLRLK